MFKYLLIFLLSATTTFAEIVKKIEVSGNQRVSKETIKVYGEISVGSNYSNFDLEKILNNLYETEFFENVEINFTNGTMSVAVKEYQVINEIQVEGEKANKLKEALKEKLNLKEKGSFIKSKLNKDIEIIKMMYASIGFNFVKVNAKIKQFTENRVNLIYEIQKGEKTKITKINFIGDKKIKEKRLRDIIVSEENKFWKVLSKNTNLNYSNTELDKRLLVNYYKSIGYYDVQIISSNANLNNENETILTYNINAGTRYKVSKVYLNISDVLDKNAFIGLEKSFKKVAGKYYSPFKVKKLLDEVDLLIEQKDLQFIEHSVNEIISEDYIEVKINIFEGSKQLVERINIKGNTITNEAVIRSELELDEGDPYNKLKIEKSIANLKSRNIFGEVKYIVSDGLDKNQKIINISVEEKPTGEISAGAGIGTNGGSFMFSVSENNWMGQGMKLSSNLDIDAETVKGSLSLVNPDHNFSGNALSWGVSSTTNDKQSSAGYKNNLLGASVGTSFEQYQNIFISPTLSLTYDDLQVSSTTSKQLQKQKGTFTDLAFGYGIMNDQRDRKFMPTDGYILGFGQTLPVYADSPYIKNSFSASLYESISPNIIGAAKFWFDAAHGLNDEDVRLSKRISAPDRRLRGFEKGKIGPKDNKDYVGGNYATTMNFEASLPKLLPEATKIDVGVFLDVGNVWGVDYDSTIDDSNKIRSTVGFVSNWLSPVGPMSFIFSRNIVKASTDVTESFSFRLGTSF